MTTEEINSHRVSARNSDTSVINNPNIDHDAREFGLHVIQGGWRLGLLVARNVVKAPGRVPAEELAPKTNASEFARRSKTSTTRVLRYLDAWERAADAGLVPHASELTPGQEVLTHNGHPLLLDVDALPSWQAYYRTPRPPARPVVVPSPTTTYTAAPTSDGQHRTRTQAEAVNIAAANHAAVIADQDRRVEAAIDDADRRYRAARDARMHSMPGDAPTTTDPDVLALRAHTARNTEVAEVVGALRHYTERLYALALDPEWGEHGRDQAAMKARKVAERLVNVAEYIHSEGTVTDEQIRELMNSDG